MKVNYVGIKKPSSKSKGNIGDVWKQQENGSYKCNNKSFILSQQQIDNDLKNRYLKQVEI